MDRKVCVAVAAPIVALLVGQAAGEVLHVPPQAIGAITHQSSTGTGSATDFRFVPDTVIDRDYRVRVSPGRLQVELCLAFYANSGTVTLYANLAPIPAPNAPASAPT